MFGMMPWGNLQQDAILLQGCLLLAHFDGEAGGTYFADSSSFARGISSANSARLTTDFKKFGSASLQCDGGRAYVPSGAVSFLNRGTGDWSISCWARSEDISVSRMFLCGSSDSVGANSNFVVYQEYSTGYLAAYVRASDNSLKLISTTTTAPAGFFHVYFGRVGGTLYFAVNGVIVGTNNIGVETSLAEVSGIFSIGGLGEYLLGTGIGGEFGAVWLGQIDEFAISDTGLWTSNFTPPDKPYYAS